MILFIWWLNYSLKRYRYHCSTRNTTNTQSTHSKHLEESGLQQAGIQSYCNKSKWNTCSATRLKQTHHYAYSKYLVALPCAIKRKKAAVPDWGAVVGKGKISAHRNAIWKINSTHSPEHGYPIIDGGVGELLGENRRRYEYSAADQITHAKPTSDGFTNPAP